MTVADSTISESQFNMIRVGYLVAGLVVLLSLLIPGQSVGARIAAAAVGLGVLGYSIYLFLGEPDSVWTSWYILVLPLIIVVQAVMAFFKRRQPAA